MAARKYLFWFFGTVGAAIAAIFLFNLIADAYILNHRASASVETVSGFERALKPAWLAAIQPSMVFIGSSRVRVGFDPALINQIFHLKSFNYGASSATAYELRRYVQDAAAQPSVKTIIVGLDPFAGDESVESFGGGFDEAHLAVTKTGAPTPQRDWRLFTSRYLSGGALGMHALSVYLLSQLGTNQFAADRPDLFTAYGRMTQSTFDREMNRRGARTMSLEPSEDSELRAMLSSICNYRGNVYLFFPPDDFAIVSRYVANDMSGFISFKKIVLTDVRRHNSTCANQVRLFDFMYLNSITNERLNVSHTRSTYYEDPIHFRPPTGLILLRRMLTHGSDSNIGIELSADPRANEDIESIRAQTAKWAKN
ncbi:MAG TPA: hypothetical protein VET48_10465 [Steroidobacteraceae bacterium]|nr:hypothetical protein [Steroidobacteraceae bacterium]